MPSIKTPISYGTLKVRKNGEEVNLTFTDRDLQFQTRWKLHGLGFEIVDDFFGYAIQSSVEDAVRVAKVFCRDREEA